MEGDVVWNLKKTGLQHIKELLPKHSKNIL
jgi:hypothetical protein